MADTGAASSSNDSLSPKLELRYPSPHNALISQAQQLAVRQVGLRVHFGRFTVSRLKSLVEKESEPPISCCFCLRTFVEVVGNLEVFLSL